MPFRLILLAITISFAAAAADRQPNVIVLLADDLGYGELSCQGNAQINPLSPPSPVFANLRRSPILRSPILRSPSYEGQAELRRASRAMKV